MNADEELKKDNFVIQDKQNLGNIFLKYVLKNNFFYYYYCYYFKVCFSKRKKKEGKLCMSKSWKI